jgi:hypothetical protein
MFGDGAEEDDDLAGAQAAAVAATASERTERCLTGESGIGNREKGESVANDFRLATND